ncbi:hypothetical protein NDU88_000451 [Pleurodeles waltl]|uniref:Uncharacterized protein n=1 Tax=Pleurodeles waltl TaxID=8319 RepID=A0AAV7S731_PLEWA|nr:hypothetical protein NDU88_000451 [Pleurodeles waltl]
MFRTAFGIESAVYVSRWKHVTSCTLSERVLPRRRPGRVGLNYLCDSVRVVDPGAQTRAKHIKEECFWSADEVETNLIKGGKVARKKKHLNVEIEVSHKRMKSADAEHGVYVDRQIDGARGKDGGQNKGPDVPRNQKSKNQRNRAVSCDGPSSSADAEISCSSDFDSEGVSQDLSLPKEGIDSNKTNAKEVDMLTDPLFDPL